MRQEDKEKQLIKSNGTYLITGGLGELGLIFAKYFLEQGPVNLILNGHSELDDKRRLKLEELNQMGGNVVYIKADITQRKEAALLVEKARERFETINGVIHSAGIIRDAFILKKKRAEVEDVLGSKVYGTKYLDEAVGDEKLDFFVMFSSVAGVLGNVGQSDYGYANSYMDYFAKWRNKQCELGKRWGKTVSINWPLWKDGKMNVDERKLKFIQEKIGMLPLEKEAGIAAFEKSLQVGESQFLVISGDGEKISSELAQNPENQQEIGETPVEREEVSAEIEGHQELTHSVQKKLIAYVEDYLKEIIGCETQIPKDKIRVQESFGNYGIESVMIMDLTKKMEDKFGPLSKTLFFEYDTIKDLTNYLIKNKKNELLKLIGETVSSKPVEHKEKVKQPASTIKKSMQIQEKSYHEMNYNLNKNTNKNLNKSEDIAIIGMAGRYPMANDLDEFWENLKQGKDCITTVPEHRWDHSQYFDKEKGKPGKTYSKWGGFIDDIEMFDALFFNIPPIEAEFLDPQERLFLETTWQAIEDAGYTRETLKGKQVGVFVGAMYGLYQLLESTEYGGIIPGRSSFASIANRVSYYFDFHGPSISLDTMCSSSLITIHLGCDSIRKGESDVVVVGGVNLSLHPKKYIQLSQGNFLSTDGRCRSFGEGGDGYVPGEGVGTLVLKSLSQAIKDNDHIYGVIKGTAVNAGGRTNGYTVPNPNAQYEVISKTLKETNINPRTISYIEAHGTGTALGDPIEIKGLTKAYEEFGDEHQYCSIGSVKSNIGHLESAAGVAAVTKVLLQLQHKQLVPSIHSSVLNPFIDFKNTPFYVQHKLEAWKQPCVKGDNEQILYPRRAGISAFGAGGANAHLIIEEYEEMQSNVETTNKEKLIFVLSAKNKERLKAYANKLNVFIKKHMCIADGVSDKDNVYLEQIEEAIKAVISQLTGIERSEIQIEDYLGEYGIDNLKFVQMKEILQKELSLEESSFMNKTHNDMTIKELITYIATLKQDISLQKEGLQLEEHTDICIRDMAYTLQVGREEMDERVAIVADNLEELQQGLEAYSQGKEDVAHIKYGNIKEYREKFEELLSDDLVQEYVKKLMCSGELIKIAQLWVMGAQIDWTCFYMNENRRKISLPTYPFEKTCYWITPIGEDNRLISQAKSKVVSIKKVKQEKQSEPEVNLEAEFTDENTIMAYLKDIFAKVLKIPVNMISEDENFESYGIDSIYITRLNAQLEKQFGELPSTLFFTYKNLRGLSKYFIKNKKNKKILKNKENYSKIITGNNKSNDIAIIGIAGCFPEAEDLQQFAENLQQGKDCITEIPKERWDYRNYPQVKCKWGGFIQDVDKFDPQFFGISPNAARFMDPQERLFLESVWQCIEDAGYTPDQLSHNKLGDNRSDVGVYAGVSFNTYSLLGARDFEQDSDVPINSQSYSVANRISYLLNLSGPSLSVDTACSSSLYAIHLACQGIINGECEMAIAGGVNLTLHPSKYVMLSNGKFLAEDGHCRSFGEGGSGYVPGEGVGAILLKSLSQAEKDKDHIYAVIKATAINHGGRTHGYSVPNPVAQTEVIEKALNKANIDPRTITYVEAHGTGTELGDPIEITALTEAFNKYTSDKQYCAIGSVKSNIGHLEAAAGVSQVIKVLLQMKYKRLFPSLLNADQVNHNIDFRGTPFYVQIKDEIWRSEGLRRAGISSFGVGGVNVHMILEEYSKQPEEEEKTHNTEVVFPISSRSQEGVREYVKLFKAYLENNINAFKSSKINRLPRMEDIAFTLFNGRIRLPYRIAFVAKNYEELLALMDSYLKGISQPKIFEGKVRDKYSKCMAEGLGEKPFELATMWIQYEKIPDDIYKEYASIKVALPTYPFEKEAYWCYKRNEIKEQTPIIAATIKENRIVEQVEENKNTNQLLDIEFLTELTNELESNRLELMMKYIQNIFAQLLGFSEGKMPDVEQGYFEMGLESIETKQAYIKMQDALGVELSEQVFFNYPNIYETSQYILSLIDFDELEEKLESGELDQELESNQAEEIKEIDKQIVNTNMADIMKEVVISEEIQNISDDEVIRQLKELLDESGIA